MKDGVCIQIDRFDYSAGVASTGASGVSVGFVVAFGVAVTLPFGVALVDAVRLADGDGDGFAGVPLCRGLDNSAPGGRQRRASHEMSLSRPHRLVLGKNALITH